MVEVGLRFDTDGLFSEAAVTGADEHTGSAKFSH
jgi:hypothetical protein